jgi:hypothetical protein
MMTGKTQWGWPIALWIAALTGCGSDGTSSQPNGTGSDPDVADPGVVTGPQTPVSASVEVPESLREALAQAAASDGTALKGTHAPPLDAELGYDPASASGLELIQNSLIALSDAELRRLGENGLAISKTREFPTFPYGYKTIYSEDLPVYVSADSVLFAVHRSFDEILKQVEFTYLIPELREMLGEMRARLQVAEYPEPLQGELDVYLTLAESLLTRKVLAPASSGDAEAIADLYDLAVAGEGHRIVTWLGIQRDEDFSQFRPRGHYTDEPILEQYFRTMILLGRADLRLIETQGNGEQVFHRSQFDAAVALDELMSPRARERWQRIDRVIGLLSAERDSMSPADMASLLAELGVKDFVSARGLDDTTIAAAISGGDWGAQRIASRIIYKEPGVKETLPLDRSFALFGQRYTVDSHVFVNTTYDRVEDRLMPDPLDVAFAALGNDAALEPLSNELTNASYAAGLARTRVLVDAHEADYWESSIQTSWLSALRALSPTAESLAAQPSVFRTRAAQNRILNTQLASWAELRHGTILYTKQSYTGGNACEFPDAYVDPYPEFYARLGRLAGQISEIADEIDASTDDSLAPRLTDWADNFQAAMAKLERMAENQKTGTPHDAELMDFVNDAVSWTLEHQGCDASAPPVPVGLKGWYLRLFFDQSQSLEQDPTIADVHTQPTDEAGNDVGRVLHVGTGLARLLVITVETCNGPRAYAGLASSYGQTVEENWKRMDDPTWAERIAKGPFPDPAWMKDVLAEQ